MSDVALHKRWLLVDTDCGVDDAVALCMAMCLGPALGFELKLITTSFGNCKLDQVGQNVAKCRRACGYGLANGPRVVQGAGATISGKSPINASYFHGRDGLGDADVPEVKGFAPDLGTAAKEIVALCREAQEAGAQLSLVTLGPLTNLALALREEPLLPMLLDSVVVMGGCGNGRGNNTRVAEFNIVADPEAAAEVFAASWQRLVAVPWECCVRSEMPFAAFDKLLAGDEESRSVRAFLTAICRLPFVDKRSPKATGAIICDATAMAVALSPDEVVCEILEVHVDIELEGRHTRGQTVVDYGHCFDGVVRPRNVQWVTALNLSAYHRMLSDTFLHPAVVVSK